MIQTLSMHTSDKLNFSKQIIILSCSGSDNVLSNLETLDK